MLEIASSILVKPGTIARLPRCSFIVCRHEVEQDENVSLDQTLAKRRETLSILVHDPVGSPVVCRIIHINLWSNDSDELITVDSLSGCGWGISWRERWRVIPVVLRRQQRNRSTPNAGRTELSSLNLMYNWRKVETLELPLFNINSKNS